MTPHEFAYKEEEEKLHFVSACILSSSKIRLSSGQVQVTMEGAMRGIATANLAQGWLEINVWRKKQTEPHATGPFGWNEPVSYEKGKRENIVGGGETAREGRRAGGNLNTISRLALGSLGEKSTLAVD
ncbi:hypothetical protein T03_7366 [Trichinella britovi]|uniref:Uncharacterized protein n=1 Tax=Trichinella britovi TaxID=45882 RepID=A0A0V1CNC7_TRIBR|nr:hypothetical protein T03_7366 [Trichinella britovi]